MPKKFEVVFDQSEPKKHSVRYKTSAKDAPVDSIYVYRFALSNPPPRAIRVSFEEVE